jgi:hypothetical protein
MSSPKPLDLTRSDKTVEIKGISRDVRKPRSTDRQPSDPSEQASTLVGLISREAARKIDKLIDDLTALRNKLENESNRIQTDIVQYASLSTSAVELTKNSFRQRYSRTVSFGRSEH